MRWAPEIVRDLPLEARVWTLAAMGVVLDSGARVVVMANPRPIALLLILVPFIAGGNQIAKSLRS